MSVYKVDICGVTTSKLPVLKDDEKEELFEKIKKGANAFDLSENFTPVNAYSSSLPLGQLMVNVCVHASEIRYSALLRIIYKGRFCNDTIKSLVRRISCKCEFS